MRTLGTGFFNWIINFKLLRVSVDAVLTADNTFVTADDTTHTADEGL